MTPEQFIAKWRGSTLTEKSASQSHFNDLCRLLDVPTPTDTDRTGVEYTFEKAVKKTKGGLGFVDVWKNHCFGWEYKGPRKNLVEAYAQLKQYTDDLQNPPLLIVSDMQEIRIHTNFTDTIAVEHVIPLIDLRVPEKRELLRNCFVAPEKLRPDETHESVTAKAATRFAEITRRLRQTHDDERRVAHFVNKLVFCLFVEDIGLLPDRVFADIVEEAFKQPDIFGSLLANLFRAMAIKGGYFGATAVPWFNGGLFDDEDVLPVEWLRAPLNPNGRGNADVVKPYWNGLDLTRRPRDYWLVDFPLGLTEQGAAIYELPFEYGRKVIKPTRVGKREARANDRWWEQYWPRPEMRRKISALPRYIVTPEVAKHRLFFWLSFPFLPDKNLTVIARDDDTTFGILHSRFHEAWSLRLGTSLEDRPRYTPTTTFETFPFPEGLSPNIPAADYASDPRAIAIAEAARALDRLRNAWLNPPDLIKIVPEVVPGFPDRILPANPTAEKELKKRTLTNLYNERPTWLANAHRDLDAAVAAAYGWAAEISEEDALARLLDLNRARSKAA